MTKNRDKPTAHKLSWRWTCTSTRSSCAQRRREQRNHTQKIAFSLGLPTGEPRSRVRAGTNWGLVIFDKRGTRGVMDVSQPLPPPSQPRNWQCLWQAARDAPFCTFGSGWQSKGAIIFGASNSSDSAGKAFRPRRGHGLQDVPCYLSPIGNADTPQCLGCHYEEGQWQPDSASDRHICRRRVPSHKARANSSQRPALSQGYRNLCMNEMETLVG